MSSIKRWFESLSYLPGYYRLFFLYIAIILVVFISTVFHVNLTGLVMAGFAVAYSGIILPLFLQKLVAKVSQRLGWWIGTTSVLVGFYLFVRVLVILDLLGKGYVYKINVYGILWSAAIAAAGVVNLLANQGLSGLRENISRDLREISVTRNLAKGEPLILDKRTVAIVLLFVVFTAGIFSLRVYFLRRPDFIAAYVMPTKVGDKPCFMSMMFVNQINRPVSNLTIEYSGYYRYPAQVNYTGKNLTAIALQVRPIAEAFQRAAGARRLVVEKERRQLGENVRELLLDFSPAFRELGLYKNETSHVQILSKFIVRWDTKEKRLLGVWVGTPGIPFLKWINGTRLDGRGFFSTDDPYSSIIPFGKITLLGVQPGQRYGFNLSGIFYPWPGAPYKELDQFSIHGYVQLESGRVRELREFVLRKQVPGTK